MVSQLRLVDFGYSCRSPEDISTIHHGQNRDFSVDFTVICCFFWWEIQEGKALRTRVGSPYYATQWHDLLVMDLGCDQSIMPGSP